MGAQLRRGAMPAINESVMTVQEFRHLADNCLGHVARWLEGLDPDDADYSTTDGMVTIEFPDGVKYVLNRQSGNHQMWFAAGARAWHYTWDEPRRSWSDDKDGHDLYGRIAEVVGAKIGRAVALEPPAQG